MLNARAKAAAVTTTVPRYTSYPTAPHLRAEHAAAARDRLAAAARAARSVSVYVHVPYCDRLCWFCACHTRHTLQYEPVVAYVSLLEKEIGVWSRLLGKQPKLSALHLGGGSPSLLRPAEIDRLSLRLREAFEFLPDAEISVELDPSDGCEEAIPALARLGMNRASIGVQDFSPQVQTAINRPQTFEQTARLIAALREHGIRSLNIDALYGLPKQNWERLEATLEGVLSLSPDRIALFGYAHVPWMKKHQRMIDESDLPSGEERLMHAASAAEKIAAAGYARIGIDHFAMKGDSLAVASAQGRLRRNFQGYTTDQADVLIGFGASAIGRTRTAIVQNEVAVGRYQAALEAGTPATGRGALLDRDDEIRAWIIERLMCDFGFRFDRLNAEFAESADYVALARRVADECGVQECVADEHGFRIACEVKPYARIVASRFDAYLETSQARYSRAV
jgi:oxygen-independent coproporphyrinogen-3 oxidase